MNNGLRTRIFPESNYKAIYVNDKTIRLALDTTKPITELEWPEFYDVKITGYCKGKCPWCYQDSKATDHPYEVLNNIDTFFGPMTENQKPFQVALGGGEPTTHPQFIEILERFYNLGITPNYTTNGMDISPELLEATKKYCGGVAVSTHPHLMTHWKPAVEKFLEAGLKVNFHVIISGRESIEYFQQLYAHYSGSIDYFVLLPYTQKGRAKPYKVTSDLLFDFLLKQKNTKDIAFGANFYEDLKEHHRALDISLYEPEIMSKYLDMKDMSLHPSSFAPSA